jgi:two-component system chemotaxis sensor kinase CheA
LVLVVLAIFFAAFFERPEVPTVALALLLLAFWILLAAWDAQVHRLKIQTEQLLDLEKNLEAEQLKVHERACRVAELSGVGFFGFGPDFVIRETVTSRCQAWFGTNIQGRLADEVLFAKPQLRDEFRQGLALFFSGQTQPEVIFDLLEPSTQIGSKVLELAYTHTDLNEVLVIVRDRTVDKEWEQKQRQEELEKGMMVKVLAHRNAFADFTREAQGLFDALFALESSGEGFERWREFTRLLHTFKADAGFFDFTASAKAAHEFETYLSDTLTLGQRPVPEENSLELKRSYFLELRRITDNLGEGWLKEADAVLVPRTSYRRLLRYAQTAYPSDKQLKRFLDFHRQVPVRTLFQKLPDLAQSVAASLGKRVAPMTISGGEVRIVTDKLEPLAASFVHLVRNSIDHGLETVREREALGKPLAGSISLEILDARRAIVFRFQDDGRGISYQKVVDRARELNWLDSSDSSEPLDEQGLLAFLFRPGFSTASGVSAVSGRGIGLSAVRHAVDALRGSIRVLTRPEKGTTFEIIIPWEVS